MAILGLMGGVRTLILLLLNIAYYITWDNELVTYSIF